MDLTVLACAKLVADGYDDVRWWIVGDGSAMQEVLRTIRECRMEDYVITVGMKDNPYPYIRQANLYVQPSRIESFGLTIAEALMIGKPVVSTDTYGARELCKRYCNFTLCKIDEISLAQEVERLILLPNANNKGDDLLITKVEKENINAMRMLESIL